MSSCFNFQKTELFLHILYIIVGPLFPPLSNASFSTKSLLPTSTVCSDWPTDTEHCDWPNTTSDVENVTLLSIIASFQNECKEMNVNVMSLVLPSVQAETVVHKMRCCSQLLSVTAVSTLLRLLKPCLTQIFPHRDIDMWGAVWLSRLGGCGRILNLIKNISLVLRLQSLQFQGSYICTNSL